MKKKKTLIFLIVFLIVFLFSTTGCEKQTDLEKNDNKVKADQRTITDMAGNEVTIKNNINNIAIVGLYPLPSILTIYQGNAKNIIAIDESSKKSAENTLLSKFYPEILEANTNCSKGNNINIEELIKLNPDIVLYNTALKEQKEIIENAGLKAVGITIKQKDFNVLETYNNLINFLNTLLNKDNSKAFETISFGNKVLEDVKNRTKDITEKKKVLFIYRYDNSGLIVSGGNFFGTYWANSINAISVTENMEQNGPSLTNMEQIQEWNPDVIFITNFTKATPNDLYENKINNDIWNNINAVKNHRVYKMPLGSYRTFTPGIDSPLIFYFIGKNVYPKEFSDINLNAEFKKYYEKYFNLSLTDEDLELIFNPNKENSMY